MTIQQVIHDFKAEEKPGKFPHLSRESVGNEVYERYSDPYRINQGVASLCGPAALAFCVLSSLPAMWVDFVTSLYDRDSARLGHLMVTPSAGCHNARLNAKIAAADWVGLASIRDSENAVFNYSDPDDTFSGITMPGGLEDWLKKVGFTGVREETNVFFSKGVDSLREATDLKIRGYQVCLFIWGDVLSGKTGGHFTVPSHWVVMARPPVLASGARTISMDVFTWGSRRTINMPLENFLKGYFGYVAGKWP